jgi:hypothetical protein
MPQARQRPSAGGVNRLEERLWPSSPAKTSLRRAGGSAAPIRSIAWVQRPANQSTYAENNRFNGNVNWCFSARFVIACTALSLYLQTEVGGRNRRDDESRLKNYSGLTVYG